MSTEVVKHETKLPEVPEGSSLLAVILKAVADPRIDADKLMKLIDAQERISKEQQRDAYAAALSRLQAKLPQIEQTGVIMGKDRNGTQIVRSRYAPLEDIDSIIKPLTTEEGFAFSFDTEETPSGKIKLIGKLSHKDGHSESKSIPLPIDKNDYRTAIQDHGSTISFGRRYLIKMHLNLIEKYEDNDGQDVEPISDEQLKDLEIMLVDAKADKGRFLQYMGADSLAEISKRDYQKAITALESKKRSR